MQERDKQAYEQLLLGIQGYMDKCLENISADRTTTAVVKYADDDDYTLYTISMNGQIYSNVPTIGGVCGTNEIVQVLIPQGNYSNMFILKGGSGNVTINDSSGGGSTSDPLVSSVNGKIGNVVLTSTDVGAVDKLDIEVGNIDFSTYFS